MSCSSSFLTLLPPSPYLPLSGRSGDLPFTLTNDYVFKAVFQTDKAVLRALLCSLLDLESEEIRSIVIQNALLLGTTIESKDTVLDIRLVLNGKRFINIEMQIKNEHNWPERSLYYLCRAFCNLETGEDYANVKPAHHIGILDFSLPHLGKQFYSHYLMIDETTHELFSDKLRLSVLNLTQTALATEHDRQSGLTRWAAAFKAATWEEFQMLAEEDPIFQKVSDALYLISQNREVAEECLRRQEAAARRKRLEDRLAEQEHTLAEQEHALAEQEHALAEKEHALAEKDAELARLRAQIKAQSHEDQNQVQSDIP